MLNLRRSSTAQSISPALQRALTGQGAPSGLAPKSLQVLTTQGRYSNRNVSYFRVFDQLQASQRDVSIRSFRDLDSHPELIIGSGHTEHNGAMALTGRAAIGEGPAPSRERADRAAHQDDEHLVFWDAAASRSSAARLSEAAASWLQAQSIQVVEPAPPLPTFARA